MNNNTMIGEQQNKPDAVDYSKIDYNKYIDSMYNTNPVQKRGGRGGRGRGRGGRNRNDEGEEENYDDMDPDDRPRRGFNRPKRGGRGGNNY